MSGRAKEAKAIRAPASARQEPSFQQQARGAELQRAIETIRRGTAPAGEMCRALRLVADLKQAGVLRDVKKLVKKRLKDVKENSQVLCEAVRTLGEIGSMTTCHEILSEIIEGATDESEEERCVATEAAMAAAKLKCDRKFDSFENLFAFMHGGKTEIMVTKALFLINSPPALRMIILCPLPVDLQDEINVKGVRIIEEFRGASEHANKFRTWENTLLAIIGEVAKDEGRVNSSIDELAHMRQWADAAIENFDSQNEEVRRGSAILLDLAIGSGTFEKLDGAQIKKIERGLRVGDELSEKMASRITRIEDKRITKIFGRLGKSSEIRVRTVAAHGFRASAWNDEVAEAIALLLEDEDARVQKTIANRGMKRHEKVDAAIRRTLEGRETGTQLALLDFMLEKDLLHFKETLKKVLKTGSTRLRMEVMETIGKMTTPGFEEEITSRLVSQKKVGDYEIKNRYDDKAERAEVEEQQIARNALTNLAAHYPQEVVDVVKKRYLAEKNVERKEVFFEVLVEMHKIHEHVLWTKRETELEAKVPDAIEKVKWRVPLKEIRELHPEVAQAVAVLRKTGEEVARYRQCIEQQKREMESLEKRIAEPTTLQTPEYEELMKRMAEINANLALQAKRLEECEAEHAQASRSHHFGHLAKWWLVNQELKPTERKKPWGHETFEIINERKSLTRLYMNAMEEGEHRPSTSFHFHARKDVTIVVASGKIMVVYDHDKKEVVLEPGKKSAIDLPPATPHQIINIGDEEAQVLEFEAPCDNQYAIVSRRQTLMDKQRALASKDDICRLEDPYERKGEGYAAS